MKNILILGFAFSFFSAGAQTGIFEKVFYPQYQFHINDLVTNENNWYIGGSYSSCDVPFVDKINEYGNLVWEKLIYVDSMGYGWVQKLSVDTAGNIIAAGYMQALDDVVLPAHNFVASLNSIDGSINWIKFSEPDIQNINLIVSDYNLIYFYSNDNGTLVYDSNGNLQNSFFVSIVSKAINGDVVLSDGTNNFFIADTAGNIIHTYPYAEIGQLQISDSNQYAGFYQSHLCLFDSSFQVTSQSTTTFSVPEFLSSDSSGFYFCYGASDLIIEHYSSALQFDTSYLIETLTQSNFRNVAGMKLTADFLAIAGNESLTVQEHGFIKVISKTGNPNPPLTVDAGIQNLIMNFDSLQWNVPALEFGTVFYTASFDIMNFGINTIHNLLVYYHFPVGINCVTDIHELNYAGINLSPGNTYHVEFNSSTAVSFHFYPYTFSLDVCFWTAAPSSKLDLEMNNNKSCSAIVGINEPAIQNPIVIYPNPSGGLVNIEIPSGKFSSIKIIDLLGRAVYQSDISGDNKKIIVSKLNAGYYRIVISDNDTIYNCGLVIN